LKVVNLFAGPGVGKSTIGAVLYGMLSMGGYAAEYIPEFAKVLTWQDHKAALRDQLYIFAKQDHRLEVLRNQPLDFVVMDGPLPLGALYIDGGYFKNFEPLVMEVFNSYDNVNFFLERDPDMQYRKLGRNQTEDAAALICERTLALLDRYGVPFSRVPVSHRLPGEMFTALTGKTPPLSTQLKPADLQ
jgi:AAA domain